MALSESDAARIRQAFAEKIGVLPPCPMCGQEGWVLHGFGSHPFYEKLLSPLPALPTQSVTVVILLSRHCGYLATFGTHALGLDDLTVHNEDPA